MIDPLAICEKVVREVFDAFPPGHAIKLPNLLDNCLRFFGYKNITISRDELRRNVMHMAKPGGWLTPTNEGIMISVEFQRMHGSLPMRPGRIHAVSVVDDQATKDLMEREKEVKFFRTSGCVNTCPKCSAPLPCGYH